MIHTERNSGTDNDRIRRQNAIYDSMAGIVFMGTPQAGSDVVKKDRVKMLERVAAFTFKKPPKKIIKALAAHSDEVEELSDNFQKTTIFTKHDIEICSYYETVTTKFLGEEVSLVAFGFLSWYYTNVLSRWCHMR